MSVKRQEQGPRITNREANQIVLSSQPAKVPITLPTLCYSEKCVARGKCGTQNTVHLLCGRIQQKSYFLFQRNVYALLTVFKDTVGSHSCNLK